MNLLGCSCPGYTVSPRGGGGTPAAVRVSLLVACAGIGASYLSLGPDVLERVPRVDESRHDEEHECGEDSAHGLPDLRAHHAASEASGSASIAGSAVSPRVLVARRAITAEARMKMLPTRSARWKPDVSAWAEGSPAASRWSVRLVDTAVKIASPSAPPSHCDALSSAAARPALSAGTPAFAAVATATNRPAIPSPTSSSPGSRSVVYEPPTGMRDSQ